MARPRATLVTVAALAAAAASVGVGAMTATGDAAPAALQRLSNGWPERSAASVEEAERLAAADRAAAAGSAETAAPAGQTLTLVTREVRGAEIDIPPAGFGPGDFFLFEEDAFDRSGAQRIGRDSGRCELGLRTFTCEATLQVFGKGKIRVASSLFSEGDNVLPVTGGSGAYQGVGGEVSVFDLANGRSVLVFHLVR
jgi:hypothetical protein